VDVKEEKRIQRSRLEKLLINTSDDSQGKGGSSKRLRGERERGCFCIRSSGGNSERKKDMQGRKASLGASQADRRESRNLRTSRKFKELGARTRSPQAVQGEQKYGTVERKEVYTAGEDRSPETYSRKKTRDPQGSWGEGKASGSKKKRVTLEEHKKKERKVKFEKSGDP